MSTRLMSLERWAEQKYGDDSPSIGTLRRWARDGKIYPAPVKQGRSYFVQPDAEYLNLTTPNIGTISPLIRSIHESAKARRA